jgi:hypothetical protein
MCRRLYRGEGYFFFRRLVVFFAVFFAAAFVFRFFAIAALLSMSGWRHRCSAVANRHALLSDYYKTKKITVTPLNFLCKRRAALLETAREARLCEWSWQKLRRSRDCAAKNPTDAKVSMECGFLALRNFLSVT